MEEPLYAVTLSDDVKLEKVRKNNVFILMDI